MRKDVLRDRLIRRFGNCCAYCRCRAETYYGVLELEHILPECAGGFDEERNRCLCCRICNLYKGKQVDAVDPLTGETVRLFNPWEQEWAHHFKWDGPWLLGTTSIGRATVQALRINHSDLVTVREGWIVVGWHPPDS